MQNLTFQGQDCHLVVKKCSVNRVLMGDTSTIEVLYTYVVNLLKHIKTT